MKWAAVEEFEAGAWKCLIWIVERFPWWQEKGEAGRTVGGCCPSKRQEKLDADGDHGMERKAFAGTRIGK